MRLEFSPLHATIAGFTGIVIMTVVAALGAASGVRIDVPMLLGTFFLPKGERAWDLGLVLHLAAGVCYFYVYAIIFDLLGLGEKIGMFGTTLGVVHGIGAGIALGVIERIHPRLDTEPPDDPGLVKAPGFLALRLGMAGPAVLIGAHVVYGFIGSVTYAIPLI